jgi:hypothetical protein
LRARENEQRDGHQQGAPNQHRASAVRLDEAARPRRGCGAREEHQGDAAENELW